MGHRKRISQPFPEGGAELTIAAMEDWERQEIGRKTYLFARRVMGNPELKARIQARAAEIREQERRGMPYGRRNEPGNAASE